MTVKLLCDWDDDRDGKQYKALNLLTTGAGTESDLIEQKIAESNLTGGTAYVAPTVQRQTVPVFASTNLTGGVYFSVGGKAQNLNNQSHRLVTLGDSICIAGDTINATYDLRYDSWGDAAAALSGGRVQFVRNAGRGGDKSADLIARFDADVKPWKPTVVAMIVGTNDFTYGVSDATYRANIKALDQKCRSIGAEPVFLTSPPVNSMAAGDRLRIFRNGLWLRRWANQNNILVIDAFGMSVDPASDGTWKSGADTGDGIHPGSAMHQTWGTALASVFNQLIPAVSTQSYFSQDSLNLVSNGLFQNGTTIATGYDQTWGVDSGSAAFSVVADSSMIGGKAQRHTLTSATGHASLSQTVSTGFSVGDVISMECDTNLTCVGGYSHIEVPFTGSTGLTVVSSHRSIQGRSKFYREFVVPAGTTAIKFTMSSGYGASAVTGTVDFGGLTVRNLSNPAGAYGNDGGSILTPDF